jgi:DNA relaxase NicK
LRLVNPTSEEKAREAIYLCIDSCIALDRLRNQPNARADRAASTSSAHVDAAADFYTQSYLHAIPHTDALADADLYAGGDCHARAGHLRRAAWRHDQLYR